jgi:hypothetical protein
MVYSDLESTWNPERKRKQRKDGLVSGPILLGVEKEKYLYNIAAVLLQISNLHYAKVDYSLQV